MSEEVRADSCEAAKREMSGLIKDGKVIKTARRRTEINGVDRLNDIEIFLNRIGHENIIHISTIGEDMIIVYRGEADIL